MKKVILFFFVFLFSCFAKEAFVEKPIYKEMPILVFDLKNGGFTAEYSGVVISQYYEGKYTHDNSSSTRKKLEKIYELRNGSAILVKDVMISSDNDYLFVEAYGESKNEVAQDYGSYILIVKKH